MTVNKDAAAEAAGDEKLLSNETDDAEADQAEEKEADAEEADDETESDAEGDEDKQEGEKAESDEDDPKKQGKWARRNARTKARIATLEEIARHESQRADAAETAATRLRALEAEVGAEPKESDYEGRPNDYIADRAAWKADMAAAARQKKSADAATKDANQAASVSKFNLFRERTMALTERYPDIEAKVLDDRTAPISQAMADVLMDSERGPEVAYYLATHREEARRIQQMTPLLAAREIGRLEAKLDAPKPRTQTNAPKPVPKVSGTGAKASKDPDKMTVEEWTAWRNAQLGLVPGRKKAS